MVGEGTGSGLNLHQVAVGKCKKGKRRMEEERKKEKEEGGG